MAKRVNPFAEDFQTIKKSADDKVLAFLQQGESEKDAEEKKSPAVKADSPEKPKLKKAESDQPQPVKKEKKTVTKSKETKPKNEKRVDLDAEWGRPTALFNTRIPERMSELLDDLVYQRKKQGKPCTKQAIAIEALEMFLGKEGILKSGRAPTSGIPLSENQ